MGNNKKEVCGVYEIRNQVNNKVYVGSSIRALGRKRDHFRNLRKNCHDNPHLQGAFNKYGEESFKHVILEEKVVPENLVSREQFYMELTQCYDRRYGYNICSTAGNCLGKKHSIIAREKQRKAHEKGPYTFISPEGEIVTRNSFYAFEREFKVGNAGLSKVERGEYPSHKGWRKFDEALIGIPCTPMIHPHTFINPEGEAVTRDSIIAFGREFGLHVATLGRVEKNLQANHKGWRKFSETEVGVPCIPMIHPHTFINPKGVAVTRSSFMEFEREFGLGNGSLSLVERGLQANYKGWRKLSGAEMGVLCPPTYHPHTFINPKGEAITRDSLGIFAKEFELSISCLSRLKRGKQKHHKDWTKPK